MAKLTQQQQSRVHVTQDTKALFTDAVRKRLPSQAFGGMPCRISMRLGRFRHVHFRLLPIQTPSVYDFWVIRRLYVHNFRCLENFELTMSGLPSLLLIGNNGVGKSTIGSALELLQRIARRINRVSDLVKPLDFSLGRAEVPMRFEIEVELGTVMFKFEVAFDFPKGFKELRVFHEKLSVDGSPLYSRDLAQVQLTKSKQQKEAKFFIDWHLIALPIIQQQSIDDPLAIFRQWLSRMLILRPIPQLIDGESGEETLEPNSNVSNFGAWFSGLISLSPSAYTMIDRFLRQVMPDLKDIKNPNVGADARRLLIQFSKGQSSVVIPFKELSDGEKCFMIAAMVLAANEAYGPLFCFWDEPDNHLALSEVGHLVLALRKSTQMGGQLIATSHNPEAIRRFSEENTFLIQRGSHLEPSTVRRLSEIHVPGDLVNALVRGDLTA